VSVSPRVRLPRCSLLDVAVVALFALIAILVTHTAADADLWGHLRFGTDLLSTHRLAERDPYSFTADRPWINHEWLAELTTAALYALGGAVGLNLLKLSVIAVIGLLVWSTARAGGGTRFSSGLLTAFALLTTYTRTQVLRPQLFSVLFFAVLLFTLIRAERGHRAPLWLLPLLFCLWANAHGGWIVGLAVLAVWAAFDAIDPYRGGASLSGERLRAPAILLASGAATLVNPYGIGLWRFLRETVGLSRPDISDWNPLLALPAGIIAIELILPALAAAAALIRRRRPSWRHAAIIGLLAFGMYRVGRIDAFLQIAVALCCAPIVVDWLNSVESRLRRKPRLAHSSIVHGMAAAGLIAASVATAAVRLDKIVVEGDWRPDIEAARFIRGAAPNVRLLTWFDWGEYAIWQLAPAGVRVSMDGRRETVYSDRVVGEHFAFYDNKGEAWRYPESIGAERVWLPTRLPVVPTLEANGWRVIYRTPRSVVLSREGEQASTTAPPVDERRAVFPGS
jgi:hypothetical protein